MIAMPTFVRSHASPAPTASSLAWLGKYFKCSDCLALLCLAIASCSLSLIAARSCHVLRRVDFEEFALEDALPDGCLIV